MRLKFLRSSFRGLLPKYFAEEGGGVDVERFLERGDVKGYLKALRKAPRSTSRVVEGMNDINKEELDRYVDVSTCDYLVDYISPTAPSKYDPSSDEPNYAADTKVWVKHQCVPFLDASRSNRWARAFWVPGGKGKTWGEYCLLRRREHDE
ncbi:mannosyltransferase [Borealophlyctis nickersoniae]|nr:mannosyltransferase [Borealophlyctis nickersoniae]